MCDAPTYYMGFYLNALTLGGLGFFFIGVITNSITKTKGVTSVIKEGFITALIGSLIPPFFIFIWVIIYDLYFLGTGFGEIHSILNVFFILFSPILIIGPLFFFIGVTALGALIYSQPRINELGGAAEKILLIVLALFIVCPMIFVTSMASLEAERNEHWGWGGAPNLLIAGNYTAGTLTVVATDPDLTWDMFLINPEYNYSIGHYSNSTAILPSGSVDVGDVITNCSGTVKLTNIESNICIGSWEFP